MLADITMAVELENKLVVPREAVLDTGTRRMLFVKKSGDVFEPREVETEAEGSGWVSVVKGLQEGEDVIVGGNFLIDSESRLKAALESYQAAAEQKTGQETTAGQAGPPVPLSDRPTGPLEQGGR